MPPEHHLQAAVLLSLLVGSIQVGITLLQLGDLTRYISHSVIVGFTLGAGSLLVLDQLKNLLGLAAVGDVHAPFVVRLWDTLTQDAPVHLPTLQIGLEAIVVVLTLRWIKAKLRLELFPDLLATVAAFRGGF